MSLFDWFANRRKMEAKEPTGPEREIPDGLWTKCPGCGVPTYTKDLQANFMVCSECGLHMRLTSDARIQQLIDPDTWQPLDEDLSPTDPLGFHDRKSYTDRIAEYQKKTHLTDAVQTGIGKLAGIPVALGVMDFRFMGGSMGSVVGEKLCRLIERATRDRASVIIVCASGGARMQEGLLSLMQMAKISGALQQHSDARLLYIPVLTDPTTGGVTASFAMLGDIILAEPKATIGFAGRRVIEQTLREKLPEGFQTAEYLLECGFVDAIVHRSELKPTLAQLLHLHQAERIAAELVPSDREPLLLQPQDAAFSEEPQAHTAT